MLGWQEGYSVAILDIALEEISAPVPPGKCGWPHPTDPDKSCTRDLGHPGREHRWYKGETRRDWRDPRLDHAAYQRPTCGAYGPMRLDGAGYCTCTRDPDHAGRHRNDRVNPADYGRRSAPVWTRTWVHDPDTDTTRPPSNLPGPTPAGPTSSRARRSPTSHHLGLPAHTSPGDHPTWPGQDVEKGNGGGQVGAARAPGAAPRPSIHQLAQLTRLEDVLETTDRDLCPSVPADELAELEHRAWWLAPPRHDRGADDLVHLCHHPKKHKEAYVQGEQGWRCRCHCGATTRKDPIGHVEPTATQETRLEDHADAR